MSWFTYIVECKDGSFYVGITNNIEERVAEHNRGKGPAYTKIRRPVKLVFKEKHGLKSKARKREAQIKRWSRRKKLNLIKGVWRKGKA